MGRLAQVNFVQPLWKAARPRGRRDIGARPGYRVISRIDGVLACGLCPAIAAGLGCVLGIHGRRSDVGVHRRAVLVDDRVFARVWTSYDRG